MFPYVILASALLSVIASVSEGDFESDPDWVFNNNTACSYKFLGETARDIHSARNICKESNSYLASIHSQKEMNFIASHMKEVTEEPFWIGAHAKEDRSWAWDDGTPFDYTNWIPGEPNNWQNNTEVAIKARAVDELYEAYADGTMPAAGQWNDVPEISYHNVRGGLVCKKC